ncbi:hypothetical protein PRZ48_011307 [Zasmidium cellare]|uniref:Uncharacterized protein n=1 Tax=Zasmidium cellare TaxID=395010 RepID=A0ABR0E6Z5_ZASCE|nr:hypothetical protein PRZ48_011307 [Zasmidium cellare]
MADFSSFVTGHDADDAKTLDEIVSTIGVLMKERPGLQALMKYRVAKRDKRDTMRFEQFFDYIGPDLDTLNKLTECYADWMTKPSTFWCWKVKGIGDPQAYVVDAFMQDVVELRKHLPKNTSAQDTARALCSRNLFPRSTPVKVETVIVDMMNRGGRYLNLEKTLGKGICMVMGTQLSETLWYKILPKSGEKFNTAMKCVRETPAVEVQELFADLRETIIQSKLQELRAVPMVTA